jgi:uncharacterized protein YuzE
MRFTYDDEVEALYVHFQDDAAVARSDVLEDGRVVDFDDSGRPIGVEILGTSTGCIWRISRVVSDSSSSAPTYGDSRSGSDRWSAPDRDPAAGSRRMGRVPETLKEPP